MLRKHHCRFCGNVVCYACSTRMLGKHRCCDKCHSKTAGDYFASGNKNKKYVRPETGSPLFSVYGKGPHWVSKKDVIKEISMSKEGVAAQEPVTVIAAFRQAVEKNADKVAWKREVNDKWEEANWQQHYDNVVQMAKASMSQGLEQHDA
eukprot:UN06844